MGLLWKLINHFRLPRPAPPYNGKFSSSKPGSTCSPSSETAQTVRQALLVSGTPRDDSPAFLSDTKEHRGPHESWPNLSAQRPWRLWDTHSDLAHRAVPFPWSPSLHRLLPWPTVILLPTCALQQNTRSAEGMAAFLGAFISLSQSQCFLLQPCFSPH